MRMTLGDTKVALVVSLVHVHGLGPKLENVLIVDVLKSWSFA